MLDEGLPAAEPVRGTDSTQASAARLVACLPQWRDGKSPQPRLGASPPRQTVGEERFRQTHDRPSPCESACHRSRDSRRSLGTLRTRQWLPRRVSRASCAGFRRRLAETPGGRSCSASRHRRWHRYRSLQVPHRVPRSPSYPERPRGGTRLLSSRTKPMGSSVPKTVTGAGRVRPSGKPRPTSSSNTQRSMLRSSGPGHSRHEDVAVRLPALAVVKPDSRHNLRSGTSPQPPDWPELHHPLGLR